MKLIFVRHGEPDYKNDSLTEKGWEEARLTAERISTWNVTEFYVSPLGRAKDTASCTLIKMNREAIELPWLREFSYKVYDKFCGWSGVPWDFVPSDWTECEDMFRLGDGFLKFPCILENETIQREYYHVIKEFDRLLASYGYIRDRKFYRNPSLTDGRHIVSTTSEENKRINAPKSDEKVLVFFCHLGVTCLILSHLINIPFEVLCHGFFLPPTSLTILTTEERWEDEAYFRVQAIGDCTHLLTADHPISSAGLFGSAFQG